MDNQQQQGRRRPLPVAFSAPERAAVDSAAARAGLKAAAYVRQATLAAAGFRPGAELPDPAQGVIPGCE